MWNSEINKNPQVSRLTADLIELTDCVGGTIILFYQGSEGSIASFYWNSKIILVASTLGAKQKVRKVENNFVLARTNPECEENKEFICPDGKKCGEWECPNLDNNTYCNLKCDSGYEGELNRWGEKRSGFIFSSRGPSPISAISIPRRTTRWKVRWIYHWIFLE